MCLCTLGQSSHLFKTATGKCACKMQPCTRRRSHGAVFNHDEVIVLPDEPSTPPPRRRGQSMLDLVEGSSHKAVVECARSPGHFALFERRTSSVDSTSLHAWPEENGAAMARGRCLMHTLAMDSTRFTSGDLCGLLLELFQEAGLPEEVPLSCVKRLILAVREDMYDNPYHNWAHVFDVAQTIFVLATTTGLMERLDAWERFALLAAALCHDLEHPGVDTGFVARAALGDAFRHKQLEKHHTLRAFEIMADSEIGVLQGISTPRYYAFRQSVSGCILATCPANYSEIVARLAAVTGESSDPGKQFEMELLLKAADISNVIKPFPVAARWALRVTDEFFLQGDVERQHGMAVTPVCDREQQSRVAIQQGFIDHVCAPFFDAMAILYPALRPAVRVMHANRAKWAVCTDARLQLLRDVVDLFLSAPLPRDDESPTHNSNSAAFIFGARPSPPPSSLGMSDPASLPSGLSHTILRRVASLPDPLYHVSQPLVKDLGTQSRVGYPESLYISHVH